MKHTNIIQKFRPIAFAVASCAVSFGGLNLNAQASTLSLDYTCVYPLVEEQRLSVFVNADIPTHVNVGELTPAFQIDAVATINVGAWKGLSFVGTRTLVGTVQAQASISGPGLTLPLMVPMTIETVDVPQTEGTFDAIALGSTPPLVFAEQNRGIFEITIGDLMLEVEPRDINGNLTGIGQIQVECIVDPGQSQLLSEFQVGALVIEPIESFALVAAGESSLNGDRHTVDVVGSFDGQVESGNVSGNLELEAGSFITPFLGFLRIETDLAFEAASDVAGTFADGSLDAEVPVYVKATALRIRIFGIQIFSSSSDQCQTIEPVVINLESSQFSLLEGGQVSGSYYVGAFENCGGLKSIFTALLSGSVSTINLSLN